MTPYLEVLEAGGMVPGIWRALREKQRERASLSVCGGELTPPAGAMNSEALTEPPQNLRNLEAL